MIAVVQNSDKETLWPESASEQYRTNNHCLSAKLVPTFADRGCRVVSVTDPYGSIFGFLDRSRILISILIYHHPKPIDSMRFVLCLCSMEDNTEGLNMGELLIFIPSPTLTALIVMRWTGDEIQPRHVFETEVRGKRGLHSVTSRHHLSDLSNPTIKFSHLISAGSIPHWFCTISNSLLHLLSFPQTLAFFFRSDRRGNCIMKSPLFWKPR
jgi:hypothetical protein